MDISLFDYSLPKDSIAQAPARPRDASKMLVLSRTNGSLRDAHTRDLPTFLRKGDLLVCNNSKVIPARLIGKKKTGGKAELFLLRKKDSSAWYCLTKGIRPHQRSEIVFPKHQSVTVLPSLTEERVVVFPFSGKQLDQFIDRVGQTPTPPYIKRKATATQYQTVYAQNTHKGSVAAPTAGLHFTHRLLSRIKQQGVNIEYVTLHVGLGTFAPVRVRDITQHRMHPEFVEVMPKVIRAIQAAKKEGGRVIAVGTTTVRALEGVLGRSGSLPQGPIRQWINPFFYPGHQFRVVDGMLTNFHLPQSTLLMLVSAFAGREHILNAYQHAIRHAYRFYSFGDAMLIV